MRSQRTRRKPEVLCPTMRSLYRTKPTITYRGRDRNGWRIRRLRQTKLTVSAIAINITVGMEGGGGDIHYHFQEKTVEEEVNGIMAYVNQSARLSLSRDGPGKQHDGCHSCHNKTSNTAEIHYLAHCNFPILCKFWLWEPPFPPLSILILWECSCTLW